MGIPGHVPYNSISITSVDPLNAINIRQIFAFNKITQMILFNCLSNPSPSQPGKSFTIAQIQAFVIADQNCFGGFPGGAVVESLPASAGDTGSSPGWEDPTCRGATRPVSHNC